MINHPVVFIKGTDCFSMSAIGLLTPTATYMDGESWLGAMSALDDDCFGSITSFISKNISEINDDKFIHPVFMASFIGGSNNRDIVGEIG